MIRKYWLFLQNSGLIWLIFVWAWKFRHVQTSMHSSMSIEINAIVVTIHYLKCWNSRFRSYKTLLWCIKYKNLMLCGSENAEPISLLASTPKTRKCNFIFKYAGFACWDKLICQVYYVRKWCTLAQNKSVFQYHELRF